MVFLLASLCSTRTRRTHRLQQEHESVFIIELLANLRNSRIDFDQVAAASFWEQHLNLAKNVPQSHQQTTQQTSRPAAPTTRIDVAGADDTTNNNNNNNNNNNSSDPNKPRGSNDDLALQQHRPNPRSILTRRLKPRPEASNAYFRRSPDRLAADLPRPIHWTRRCQPVLTQLQQARTPIPPIRLQACTSQARSCSEANKKKAIYSNN